MTTPSCQHTDTTLELQHQSVSTYHFNTAKQLANTAIFMRLNHPHTYHTNDITTFDVTDETHRLRTFNDNWDRTTYDIKDFANEGFFFLHTTNLNIQCFSCGVIITRFPPYVSSFVIHLLASPDCKHLLLTDTTNKTDIDLHSLQPQPILHDSESAHFQPTLETGPLTPGFIKINTPLGPHYKCPACLGTQPYCQDESTLWQTHAQNFPHCNRLISRKTKFFVKQVLGKTTQSTIHPNTYYRYIKNQIRVFNPELLHIELTRLLNAGSTFQLLQNLDIYQDIFIKLLRIYSVKIHTPPSPPEDQLIHELQKQLDCVVCRDRPRQIVTMPCRHFITCIACITKCDNKCPICRTQFSHTISVLSS